MCPDSWDSILYFVCGMTRVFLMLSNKNDYKSYNERKSDLNLNPKFVKIMLMFYLIYFLNNFSFVSYLPLIICGVNDMYIVWLLTVAICKVDYEVHLNISKLCITYLCDFKWRIISCYVLNIIYVYACYSIYVAAVFHRHFIVILCGIF